jgi:hypothetical protein
MSNLINCNGNSVSKEPISKLKYALYYLVNFVNSQIFSYSSLAFHYLGNFFSDKVEDDVVNLLKRNCALENTNVKFYNVEHNFVPYDFIDYDDNDRPEELWF